MKFARPFKSAHNGDETPLPASNANASAFLTHFGRKECHIIIMSERKRSGKDNSSGRVEIDRPALDSTRLPSIRRMSQPLHRALHSTRWWMKCSFSSFGSSLPRMCCVPFSHYIMIGPRSTWSTFCRINSLAKETNEPEECKSDSDKKKIRREEERSRKRREKEEHFVPSANHAQTATYLIGIEPIA